jgi:hypothetical protein
MRILTTEQNESRETKSDWIEYARGIWKIEARLRLTIALASKNDKDVFFYATFSRLARWDSEKSRNCCLDPILKWAEFKKTFNGDVHDGGGVGSTWLQAQPALDTL